MNGRLEMSLLAVSVRRGRKWVLRDVSWRLRPGERWALLGDNGAGKTQLLKLLSGDVWPTPVGADTLQNGGRSYCVRSQKVDLIEAKRRVAYVGAEQQDKHARYGWNLPVRDLVATGLHRSDLLLLPVTAAQAKRVTAALRICGISRHAAREFLTLSYGQKRLALLARALVQDPDWLLLDEFYNGLDEAYRRRIDRVLLAASRRGQSWVATAHRAVDVPRGTHCMLELAAGRVHAVGPLRVSDLKRLAKRAGESPRGQAQARKAPSGAPVLMTMSHVDLYVDYRLVLRDLDWQLRRGEHWAVYGSNGTGKSSFLKMLYGDLPPALGGRIARAGFPKGSPIAEWKRHIGYVSPELQSDYAVDVSVLELVASGRYASIGLVDHPTAEDRRAATYWLRFFGLLSFATDRPRELSYGQLRRALIARAMAADARILLLDEPLTGLDPTQRNIMKRLLEHVLRRTTLIIAVHHPEDLPRGMTHGLRLHNRRAYPLDFHSAT
ncbi:MAG TPA: ATP-binding cassette domain-containing protein [Steroidobacteraceae bacterium]|jgi:molybdate transport system ATP-binding protein|nr:ATP-binding cassette domain-containing protein [Steroidobacteraceae bacterium]